MIYLHLHLCLGVAKSIFSRLVFHPRVLWSSLCLCQMVQIKQTNKMLHKLNTSSSFFFFAKFLVLACLRKIVKYSSQVIAQSISSGIIL